MEKKKMRNEGEDERIEKIVERGEEKKEIVEEREEEELGGVKIVNGGIVDEEWKDMKMKIKRDGEWKKRNKVKEISGEVERIEKKEMM